MKATKTLMETGLFDEQELKSLPWSSKKETFNALAVTAKLRLEAVSKEIEFEHCSLMKEVDKAQDPETYKDLAFGYKMSRNISLDMSVSAKETMREINTVTIGEGDKEINIVSVVVRDHKDLELLVANNMKFTHVIVPATLVSALVLRDLIQEQEYQISLSLEKETTPTLSMKRKLWNTLNKLKNVFHCNIVHRKIVEATRFKIYDVLQTEKKKMLSKKRKLLDSLKNKSGAVGEVSD